MRPLDNKIIGAPNFTYREFVKSDTAVRLGIANEPNEEQWQSVEALAKNVLQPIRNELGRIRITSGFRSVELCEAVGSSKNSNHARGEAADIEPLKEGVTLLDVVRFAYTHLDFRTIIAEYFPDGWIHIDYRIGGNKKSLKLKDKDHDYKDVSLEYLSKLYGGN